MFPTVEEHQGMARAAGADRMHSHGPRYPGDHRRSSLNRYSNGIPHGRPPRPEPDRPLNVVYWPNGVVTESNDPSNLDVSCITHLIYTSATVAYDGNIRLSDDIEMGSYSRARTEALEACKTLRNRNPNLKIFVSLGGSNDGSREALKLIAANEALSKRFGDSARHLASQHDIDGIELDWTHASSTSEAESFIKLTATTEGYLGTDHCGQSYQLCVALPGSHRTINLFNNMRDVNRLVDFINIRTFDLPSPQAALSYHLSPPMLEEDHQIVSSTSPILRSSTHLLFGTARQASWYSITSLLESKGTNMRKLTLGIACFGELFLGTSGPGQHFSRRETVPHKLLPPADGKEVDGAETGLAYSVVGEECFASYELPTTVRRKAELVKSKGMAGLCYSNGADDSDGDRSLIRSGFNAISPNKKGG